MDLEERWDEIAQDFIPDFELVYQDEGVTYPFVGTGDGDDIDLYNEQDAFDWVVAPIKANPEMWDEELNLVEEHNVISPVAIEMIEERSKQVLPF